MPTHERIVQYVAGSRIANVTDSVEGDGELAFDNAATIAFGVQIEIDLAFPFAKVKSLLLYNGGPGVTTIFSNAVDGAGGDVIAIPAGGAITWNANDAAACPFAINVTKLYATNGHGSLPVPVNGLRLRFLIDVTP